MYEPKHTDEHPQETKYVYEDIKIKEIIDPVQKKTQIAYNTTEHVTTVTNEKGKKPLIIIQRQEIQRRR